MEPLMLYLAYVFIYFFQVKLIERIGTIAGETYHAGVLAEFVFFDEPLSPRTIIRVHESVIRREIESVKIHSYRRERSYLR
jgi:hypothetical protein